MKTKNITPYDKFSFGKKLVQVRGVVEKVLSGAMADPTLSLGGGKGAKFCGSYGDFHGNSEIFVETREGKRG
ncbi:MAG: hypothetical protein LBD37_11110 [Treponema sp.]|jgi:hypothetical protein|nr:hypothetical protein [Treponema sp.]